MQDRTLIADDVEAEDGTASKLTRRWSGGEEYGEAREEGKSQLTA